LLLLEKGRKHEKSKRISVVSFTPQNSSVGAGVLLLEVCAFFDTHL
jgi:hypothetical protein